MSRILVTGGAGHIGSELVDDLINAGHVVSVVDNLSTGWESNVNPKAELFGFDCKDSEAVDWLFGHVRPEYVFHYAAVVGVQRTTDFPVKVFDDIAVTKNVLRNCVNANVKRIFYSSSSEVYGISASYPQNELNTPPNPRVPYAVCKYACESMIQSYKEQFDLDYTIFRFFNTYGPRQSEDFVISKFIGQLSSGNDITIYGDGSQTRTFMHVRDNNHIALCSLHDDLFVNDIVNVGHSIEVSMNELAEEIIAIFGDANIKHVEALDVGDMPRRRPDISKIRELFPNGMISLKEGLKTIL